VVLPVSLVRLELQVVQHLLVHPQVVLGLVVSQAEHQLQN
jgi:hypothetical protein